MFMRKINEKYELKNYIQKSFDLFGKKIKISNIFGSTFSYIVKDFIFPFYTLCSKINQE